MSITIIICEVETMKEPLVITMAREYASGGSEIAQKVADLLGIPLYNKELITIAAKKSGLTEEAIAASETQRSGSLIYSLYMMGNTMPLADQVYILQSNVIKAYLTQTAYGAFVKEYPMSVFVRSLLERAYDEKCVKHTM